MKKLIGIVMLATLACACSKTPRGIIPPEKMARLMADVHTGEAVIDMNRREYRTDSVKQAFKQSVYTKHGVDPETVDSSLAWYGRHIDYYMDVYDRTVEILEHRIIETGNRVAAEAALSVAGDSVDVWPATRYVAINDKSPSKTLTFSYARDENWERGDTYRWRVKASGNPEKSRWTMVTEYADGSVDYITQDLSGEGWKDITMSTDSTLDATRIYGYLIGANRPGTSVRYDSIEMIRKRVDPLNYRRYSARRLRTILPPVELRNDTTNNVDK